MSKEILNLEEAAELFGVTVKTFIKLLKEESVPGRKIGREWRFSRNALIEWIAAGNSKEYSASVGETKEFFDGIAPQWDSIRKKYYDESILQNLLKLNILTNSMTVVDLGAGDGFLSRAIAHQVHKVIAVDISSKMLTALDAAAQQQGITNIETLQADGEDVAIEENSVDVVCANMYLHHIGEPSNAINEMYRILKPEGLVFLVDFSEHKDRVLTLEMHDIWPGFKTPELSEWFKVAGFKNISIHGEDDAKINKKLVDKEKKQIIILTAQK